LFRVICAHCGRPEPALIHRGAAYVLCRDCGAYRPGSLTQQRCRHCIMVAVRAARPRWGKKGRVEPC